MVWRKETATSKWGRYSILHGPTELEPTALGQKWYYHQNPVDYEIDRILSSRKLLQLYCPQDWISITYLLFYIIVYVVVIALAQEVKDVTSSLKWKWPLQSWDAIVFHYNCQFDLFITDLVPHQWNSSLFWTSNHCDHSKCSNATAGNTRPTNIHQHQIVSDGSKRTDVTAGIAIRALNSCTSTIWERDPKVLLAPCSMENVFTYWLHKPFQCIAMMYISAARCLCLLHRHQLLTHSNLTHSHLHNRNTLPMGHHHQLNRYKYDIKVTFRIIL